MICIALQNCGTATHILIVKLWLARDIQFIGMIVVLRS